MADYILSSFQLMTTRTGAENPRLIWYGVGQWSGHIMDWAGCNFHHGRLRFGPADTPAPVFDTVSDAVAWLRRNINHIPTLQRGHHSGEYECRKGCDDREVGNWLYRDSVLDAAEGRPGKRTRATVANYLKMTTVA